MEFALDSAQVRSFSAGGRDISGLLGWLRPDAVIVDRDPGGEYALEFARGHELPVLHLSVRERGLRLFPSGALGDVGNGARREPDTIRNVLASARLAPCRVAR